MANYFYSLYLDNLILVITFFYLMNLSWCNTKVFTMSNIENRRTFYNVCEKKIVEIQSNVFFEGTVNGHTGIFFKVAGGVVSLIKPELNFVEAETVSDYRQVERPTFITKPCSKKLIEIPYGTYFTGTLRTENAVYSGPFFLSSLGLVGLNDPDFAFWPHRPLIIENYVERDVAIE